jgi:hypothetical protein
MIQGWSLERRRKRRLCTSCILPSVSPGAQTEEPANTVSTSSTLNLDSFVGSHDNGDKKKLEGVLLETVSILATGGGQPSNHSSSFY